MTIRNFWHICSVLLYLCFSPLLLQADECTPNQCNYTIFFENEGYYVANISLPEDGKAGVWGLSMAVMNNSVRLDSLSTGSSTNVANDAVSSWIAFYLTEPQSINLTAYNYLYPEQPILASLLKNTDNGYTNFLEPTAIEPQQTFAIPRVDAGFYVIEIDSTNEHDIYSGLVIQGEQMSNIINGGWVEPTNTTEGFVSFYISAPSTVQFSLFFAESYSEFGASQPQLAIEAMNTTSGEWDKKWQLLDGVAKSADLQIVEQIMQLNDKQFIELSLGNIANRSESLMQFNANAYNLDEAGNVVGLNFNNYASDGKTVPWSDVYPLLFSLKHLVRLGLYGHGIEQLSPEFFNQLTNLEVIDLGANALTELPSEISQLENLTKLNISNNQLTTLPTEIAQLQNLDLLVLSQNNLQSLPSEISQLQSLTELNISDNQLSSLPSEIGQLQNLTHLNVSSNQLSSLPSEIGQLQNLTYLNIVSNHITSLPAEIGQLQNLTALDISNNQLSALPTEIGQLQDVDFLYIHGNQLQTLPPEIGNLKGLYHLYVSNNQLQTLPAEIGQLVSLDTLALENNQLQSLPLEIGLLKSSITLSGNALVTPSQDIAEQGLRAIRAYFSDDLPSDWTDLQILEWIKRDLGYYHTQVEDVANLPPDSYVFRPSMPNVIASFPELYYSINEQQQVTGLRHRTGAVPVQLETIPSPILALIHLEKLILDETGITALNPDIANLQNLTLLSLNDNSLTSLPSEIGQLQSLNELNILNNALVTPPQEVAEQGIEAIRDYFANQ